MTTLSQTTWTAFVGRLLRLQSATTPVLIRSRWCRKECSGGNAAKPVSTSAARPHHVTPTLRLDTQEFIPDFSNQTVVISYAEIGTRYSVFSS